MRKVIKKAVCMLMACTIMLTPAVGVQAAPNVTDTSFSGTSPVTTGARAKNNNTKVYVYVTKSPTKYINVNVWGMVDSSTFINETKGLTAKVEKGVKSSITNYVYEKKYSKCRLKLASSSSGTIAGVWSPDSTQNYTVVN